LSEQASVDDDVDLDAAVLAHDMRRQDYEYQRLAIRRRMAIAAFMVLLVGGVALILAGMASDVVAKRADMLAGVIGTFIFVLSSIVGAYWGLGSFDARSMGGIMSGGGSSYRRTVQQTTVEAKTTESGRAG
jgi:hypothetical protein